MQDSFVVVASYLIIGLTEEDIHYIREHLESYGNLFVTDVEDAKQFHVEIIQDSIYPCIALKVNAVVWERFTRGHDMIEYNVVMAQNNILGALH